MRGANKIAFVHFQFEIGNLDFFSGFYRTVTCTVGGLKSCNKVHFIKALMASKVFFERPI